MIVSALRAGDVSEAKKRLTSLASFASLGRHLAPPWKVVVAGAVNAGKSSLVNAIAGYQRAVVAAVPGTTRDILSVRVALDGWPVELTDTAGLRSGGEPLEEQGMALTREAAASADLCLWVLDASTAPLYPPPDLDRPLLVVNKCDLPPAWEADPEATRVSALTGEGIADLFQVISARLVPTPPEAGSAVPFTPELARRVEDAVAHLEAGDAERAAASVVEYGLS
jgi:tRNA modification GTPase